MNVNEFIAKRKLTDADLDRMAAPYEDASFEPERRQGIQRVASRRGRQAVRDGGLRREGHPEGRGNRPQPRREALRNLQGRA